MNPKYLYLAIDAFCLLVPLSFTFHPRINFLKKWKYAVPSIALTAVLFAAWEAISVYMGAWNFNSHYTTGIEFLGLPMEEILFLFCFPYACVFLYFTLNHLIEKDHLFPHQELITSVLIVLLLIFGLYNINRAYTGPTFLITGLFLTLSMLKLRLRFMGRFYFAFLVILVPFLIISGILTGGAFLPEAVVQYNGQAILGVRLATIPLEVPVYMMLLLLLSITCSEMLEERFQQ